METVFKRKEGAWEVLRARDEDARERLEDAFIKVRRRSKNSLEGR